MNPSVIGNDKVSGYFKVLASNQFKQYAFRPSKLWSGLRLQEDASASKTGGSEAIIDAQTTG